MSGQQKTSFMEQLDNWTQKAVIEPLSEGLLGADDATWAELELEVQKAVRFKVLESYRNGQAAGPGRLAQRSRKVGP